MHYHQLLTDWTPSALYQECELQEDYNFLLHWILLSCNAILCGGIPLPISSPVFLVAAYTAGSIAHALNSPQEWKCLMFRLCEHGQSQTINCSLFQMEENREDRKLQSGRIAT